MESVRTEMKIYLLLNQKQYEYDLYHLIQAFYPGADMTICYLPQDWEKTLLEKPDLIFAVEYQMDAAVFHTLLPGMDPPDLAGPHQAERIVLTDPEDRTVTKNQLKKLVYSSLAERCGRTLPWGDLSGIRPVKLVTGFLEAGSTPGEAHQLMQTRYCVSSEKADLAVRVAVREQELLRTFDYRSGYSLYIDIPFCPSICLYCTFGSHPIAAWQHAVEPYLHTLQQELSFIARMMRGVRLDTIYIGGGTPTSVRPDQMDQLLSFVQKTFPMQTVREFTVEAGRPDTISSEMLDVLRTHPVTRISINPQTMNQTTLDRIGRNHTVRQTTEAFELARAKGFDHINMDMIVGLPGEGAAEVNATLRAVEQLGPDDFTVHSLALKRAARLNLFRDAYRPISFENSAEIMDQIAEGAARMHMTPYYLYRQKNMAGNFENVGYAREGRACLYNILIMEEKQTIIGAGCGASSKRFYTDGRKAGRAENVKSLTEYLSRIDEMCARKEALFAE